jgi:hypothetical protein
MKKIGVLVCIILIIFGLKVAGQSLDKQRPALNVEAQAAKMGMAFVRNDYKVFALYIYPEVMRMMGGQAKLIASLTNLNAEMKTKGMRFSGITFGDASTILKIGTELQCTLPQHTEIKTPNGRAVSTSTLIGISVDGGKAWTFVDTSNKDISTIRKILPHLSSAIVVPAQSPPIQYSN